MQLIILYHPCIIIIYHILYSFIYQTVYTYTNILYPTLLCYIAYIVYLTVLIQVTMDAKR